MATVNHSVPPQSKNMPKHAFAQAFSFSLPAAWAAIGVLWIITPLAYLFVLWHLITLAPSLQAYRPAQSNPLRIIDYVILSYCALEIPFSIYYKYLTYRAQKRRSRPAYTRRFLRSIFKESLENGLDPELEHEGAEEALLGKLEAASSASLNSTLEGSIKMRLRRPYQAPRTPESLHRQLESTPTLNGEYPLIANGNGNAASATAAAKSYTPSFIQTPLRPDDPRALDFQSHIRLWFHDIPYDHIARDDMFDWLSWSLYGQPYEELIAEREIWIQDGRPEVYLEGNLDDDADGIEIEGDKLGLVEHCVELVEARAGKPFPPGRNPGIKVIRLTLDPVRVVGRPLILYAFVWALQKVIIGNARLRGFKRYEQGAMSYIMRIPAGWEPTADGPEATQPLLFIHGLGMGMAQYASLLDHLAKADNLKQRPIIVLIQPHISMSFFEKQYLHPPAVASCVAELEQIAKKWSFDKSGLTVLSHSNGTMVHAWLLKALPNLVKRSCFVDPVCFCLWEPYVAYGFLYSTPKKPIEYLMRYFVGRELGIAYTLSRHFDWSSNLLFPSQIPNLTSPYHSAFFLSGKDSILNAFRIRRYLRSAGVKEVKKGENVGEVRGGMKTHQKNKHGESLIGRGRAFLQIMAWVTGELKDQQVPDSDNDRGASSDPN